MIINACFSCGKEIKNIEDAPTLYHYLKENKLWREMETVIQPICHKCFYKDSDEQKATVS